MDLDLHRSSLEEDLALDKVRLLSEENQPPLLTKKQGKRRGLLRSFYPLLYLTLLAITGLSTYILLPRLFHETPTGREFGDCGSSIPEARAKGCIFDNMSYAWVRPACHHADLLESYRNRTEMPYYTDHSLAPDTRIPIEEIMRGDHLEAWAPEKHHPMHCAFMLSKIHLTLLNHLPIDSKAREYAHTDHCGMVLMDGWLHEMPECSAEKGCGLSHLSAQFTSCGYV